MKKRNLSGELAYTLSILIMSLSVAVVAAADFGVSMIVAPAYILSLKIPALTFGQCEYIVQGLLFVAFCLLMGRVKPLYFTSFLTCLLYGAALDLWRALIPALNPAVTPPGSMAMPVRIVYFAAGTLVTALAVAFCFKTYLYPQVYDFFVKGVSQHFRLDRTKFKTAFDGSCLMVSVLMTLLLFGGFRGIGVGTLITTCVNGPLIGFFDRWLDRHFTFEPRFPALARRFSLEEEQNI